jgi:hypothetical protein
MIGAGPAALFSVLARLPNRSAEISVDALAAPDLAHHAARHGVSAWVLDGLGTRELPVPTKTDLSAGARDIFMQAARIRRLTTKVIDALAKRSITPVALKGSVLASRLFPENPNVRTSSDVDVLVAPGALDDAAAAMAGLGLRRFHDTASTDQLEDHHHLSFMNQSELVEVHFRLTNTFGRGLFDAAAVLARTMPLRFEGRDVLVLSPEDEFLYLATHAANHAFMRASWLVDLQQYLLRFPALDFHVMAARASDAGFTTAVTVTLGLLVRLLDVELPASARLAFPVAPVRRLVDQVLFSPERVVSAKWSNHALAGFALRLWMVDGPRRAARHVTDGLMRYARRALSSD